MIRTTSTALLLLFVFAAAGVAQQVVATGRSIRNPQIAVGGMGDFMVVWNEYDQRFNQQALARVYDGNGNPAGPVFQVSENLISGESAAKVAADARGNFVVVWEGDDGDGLGSFFQRFNRRAKRLGSPIRANRSASGYQVTPNVAMDHDGSFVVVWQDCPRPFDCPDLRAARFSAAGQRQGRELVIPMESRGSIDGIPMANPTPHVAVEPGGFLVGWTEQENCFRSFQESVSVIAHFTDSGLPVGEPFRLDDGECDATGWELVALTRDETGASAAFFNGVRNSFQLFAPDGDAVGPRTVIGRRNACPEGAAFQRGCEKISSAAMGSNGRFAVVWELARTTTEPVKPNDFFLAQFFDPAGRPEGERFEVVSSSSLVLVESAAAFTPDGALIVVWNQSDPASVRADRLLLRRIRRN